MLLQKYCNFVMKPPFFVTNLLLPLCFSCYYLIISFAFFGKISTFAVGKR